ncbi:unnamed protein product [Linum tenue]|uniref:SKP1-like protein n=1 Tax=Linum tenue TaxID=586396 RepID=A0AAV0K911_9ROSI|nr:unnamed protein product [Linum tenue]CAI0417949.1 unnamed protein product [Linum tenue]
MSTEEKKLITLKSSDGESFEVEEAVAMQSQTIKHMIEDGCAGDGIPIPNVTGAILAKVLEFCKKHQHHAPDPDAEELKKWDAEFAKVGQDTLYDLLMAANYLNIKDLLDLICQTVADIIKGKKPEEIRSYFKIKNDFTKEEEEEIRRENQWAFE